MKTRVIYPPNPYFQYERDKVIFLAGPIQGAADWQAEAIDVIEAHAMKIQMPRNRGKDPEPEVIIANPRAPGDWHGDYNGQVDWETRWLGTAALQGCILFWCAKEETHYCDRPHGQTTRFELGEWVGRKVAHPSTKMTIGVEDGFTNERYIRRRVSQIQDINTPFPWSPVMVFKTLKETCYSALQIAGLYNGMGR